MSLIDADELFDGGIKVRGGIVEDHVIFIPIDDVKKSIKNAPALDAVGVVRCKNCKHFRRNLDNDTYCSCVGGLAEPEEHDFCSYGERKEGVDNG